MVERNHFAANKREQGLSYYLKFIEHFPSIQTLAEANDDFVFKLWEGLGYYSRCKNLLHTARAIVDQQNGEFPATYEELLKLKGIGPYTAAAISSFAYGLSKAVVDGNVFRVLSRYFGILKPIDSIEGKNHFNWLAQNLLFKDDSAAYNQAIMDFGASICKPQIPLCDQCILNTTCIAYKNGMVSKLPIKEKRLIKKQRWFYYFVFSVDKKLLINKRTGKDIWENLNEFFLVETGKSEKWGRNKINIWLNQQLGILESDIMNISPVYKQQLTHQVISGQFFHISLSAVPKSLSHLNLCTEEAVRSLSFPKFINQHLESDYAVSFAE